MNPLPNDTATLVLALRQRLGAFLFVFFLIFTLSNIFLTAFGAIPKNTPGDVSAVEEPVIEEEVISDEPESQLPPAVSLSGVPLSITIDALDRTLPINNPESRAVADLDEALLSGVVRHPDSATLTQPGTVFILGHSSYLPVVNNKMFQAFNGIQDLEWGDTIRVTSKDTVYVYQVDKVYKAMAEDVDVPIAGDEHRLVIATCNSFGTADGRYIVEAILQYSEPLPVT